MRKEHSRLQRGARRAFKKQRWAHSYLRRFFLAADSAVIAFRPGAMPTVDRTEGDLLLTNIYYYNRFYCI